MKIAMKSSGQRQLVIAIALVAAVVLDVVPAQAQNIGQRGTKPSDAPPVETHPKVDEKAYKAALDRIPTPTQKYDPWGNARPSEPEKPVKKPN